LKEELVRTQTLIFTALALMVACGACADKDESKPVDGDEPQPADDGFPRIGGENVCIILPDAPSSMMCDAFRNNNHIGWVKLVDMQWITEPLARVGDDGELREWVSESECMEKGGSVQPSFLLTFVTLSSVRGAVDGVFTYELGYGLTPYLRPRPMPGPVPGTTEWIGSSADGAGTLSLNEELGVLAIIDPTTKRAEWVTFYSFGDEGHLIMENGGCRPYEDGPPSKLTEESFAAFVDGCPAFNESVLGARDDSLAYRHPICLGARD
jgi:hypothetical protein